MYFVAISQQGPSWDPSRTMRQQQLWDEHVTFINGLIDEGFLHLGGPLAAEDDFFPASDPAGDDRLYRTMVVVEAPGSGEVAARLAKDPWIRSGVLVSTSIDRWEVLVGDPSSQSDG